MKPTIILLLCISCICSFGQKNSEFSIYDSSSMGVSKINMGSYDENGNLVWDSSVTTSIGEKYFRFQAKNILQQGEFSIQVYSNDGSLAQYTFYNGYRLRNEFWWHGNKLDDRKYDKIYKYFKLKK